MAMRTIPPSKAIPKAIIVLNAIVFIFAVSAVGFVAEKSNLAGRAGVYRLLTRQ